MIADGHSIFKKNNKNDSLKKGADEENNVLSFAQVKEKCWAFSTNWHRVSDCKK